MENNELLDIVSDLVVIQNNQIKTIKTLNDFTSKDTIVETDDTCTTVDKCYFVSLLIPLIVFSFLVGKLSSCS